MKPLRDSNLTLTCGWDLWKARSWLGCSHNATFSFLSNRAVINMYLAKHFFCQMMSMTWSSGVNQTHREGANLLSADEWWKTFLSRHQDGCHTYMRIRNIRTNVRLDWSLKQLQLHSMLRTMSCTSKSIKSRPQAYYPTDWTTYHRTNGNPVSIDNRYWAYYIVSRP